MAEIKSTMDMVLERAAKMAAAAAPEVENEDLVKTGMRFAADYLNQKETDLAQLLGAQAPQDQVSVRKGMVQTLLRNIVLPRDEQLQESGKIALQGVLSLGGESAEIQEICQELTQILEQYGQHILWLYKWYPQSRTKPCRLDEPCPCRGSSCNGSFK